MTWARGQSFRAKNTCLQPMGSWLGCRFWGWATLPRNPHPSSGSRSEHRVPVRRQQFSEGEECHGGKGILQRKDQGRPIPLYPLRFSVDNLSWPLSSGELCSRAVGQDPGSHPPLGRRRGAGARRLRSAVRQAGVPGSLRRPTSHRDWGMRAQASRAPAPHGLQHPLPGHGWEALLCKMCPPGPPGESSSCRPRSGRSKTGVPALAGGGGAGVHKGRLGFSRRLATNWDNRDNRWARGVSRGCRNRVSVGWGCWGGCGRLQVIG